MLEDITYTIDINTDNQSPTYICGPGTHSYPNCTGYKYLSFSSTGSLLSNDAVNFWIKYSSSSPYSGTYGVISLNQANSAFFSLWDVSDLEYIYFSPNLHGSFSTIVTLSENNPFSSVSGDLAISANGTYDVSSYATATVDVPPVEGDYHDDLQQLVQAGFAVAATMLVIYLLWCLYRIIMPYFGGKK